MVASADNRGVIGFLDLRPFDGQGKGVPIKEELKKVDSLADECKLIPDDDLIEFVDSILVPIICRPTIERGKKFEKKEKRRLTGARGGRPNEEIRGLKDPCSWLELLVKVSQEGLDGASIGLEMVRGSPKGVKVKRGDTRLVEKSLCVVPRLRPDKPAINLMCVIIELLVDVSRGDKGKVC